MELNAREDVKPISDFRKDTAGVLKRLRETRKPVLLTQRGRSVAVLMDVDEFESREYDRRFAQAVAEGLDDVAKGRTQPHRVVERKLRKRLKNP